MLCIVRQLVYVEYIFLPRIMQEIIGLILTRTPVVLSVMKGVSFNVSRKCRLSSHR